MGKEIVGVFWIDNLKAGETGVDLIAVENGNDIQIEIDNIYYDEQVAKNARRKGRVQGGNSGLIQPVSPEDEIVESAYEGLDDEEYYEQ